MPASKTCLHLYCVGSARMPPNASAPSFPPAPTQARPLQPRRLEIRELHVVVCAQGRAGGTRPALLLTEGLFPPCPLSPYSLQGYFLLLFSISLLMYT